MLAAGVGRRLYGDSDGQPPKSLLRFDGLTLLARHVKTLEAHGVDGLTLVVGYRKDELIAEAEAASKGPGYVQFKENPRFREGANLSLWTARETLRSGDDVLIMDADVLYHPELIGKLVRAEAPDCLLLDRDFEPTDEPVRLCFKGGDPVEFRKNVQGDFDVVGEWPGFLKLSPGTAARLADACQAYVDAEDWDVTYEEAVRDVLLSAPSGSFAYEDATGVPWIEIDFPEDVERAENEILPRLPEGFAS